MKVVNVYRDTSGGAEYVLEYEGKYYPFLSRGLEESAARDIASGNRKRYMGWVYGLDELEFIDKYEFEGETE